MSRRNLLAALAVMLVVVGKALICPAQDTVEMLPAPRIDEHRGQPKDDRGDTLMKAWPSGNTVVGNARIGGTVGTFVLDVGQQVDFAFHVAMVGGGRMYVTVGVNGGRLRLIIIAYRAYLPQGEISADGRLVTLHPASKGDPFEIHDRIYYVVTVTQPETGAHGTVKRTELVADVAIPQQTQSVEIRADGKSPPFQPGKVIVTSKATRFKKDKLVETWTWIQGVELVAE